VIELAAAAAKSTSAWAQPGTLAFLVIFGMGVILFFVFRSMTKQLRKVNDAARAEAQSAERAADTAGSQAQDAGIRDP
jgi:flagellar biosynthesis/type III secretory pathway M-ring protein FliF/YscJ